MLEEILKIRNADNATTSDTESIDHTAAASSAAASAAASAASADGTEGERGSKIIIFSKWPEVLERVSAGLRLNDISCAYPSGQQDGGGKNDPNAELDHFKTSEETFVLLLLVDEGAVSTPYCLALPCPAAHPPARLPACRRFPPYY